MKLTESIMGMPVVIEVLDPISGNVIDDILNYFHEIDLLFSAYRKSSEISKLNAKVLQVDDVSPLVRRVLKLSQQTKITTNGYFDIEIEGHKNVSGIVKGFAIWEASQKLLKNGFSNFYIEIGGDIDIRGFKNDKKWKVGIINPSKPHLKSTTLYLHDVGMSISVCDTKGLPIYNPLKKKIANDIVSLIVIGPNVFETDRFSTAAFAMGVERGLEFIESQDGFDAIMFTKDGRALSTTQIGKYLEP